MSEHSRAAFADEGGDFSVFLKAQALEQAHSLLKHLATRLRVSVGAEAHVQDAMTAMWVLEPLVREQSQMLRMRARRLRISADALQASGRELDRWMLVVRQHSVGVSARGGGRRGEDVSGCAMRAPVDIWLDNFDNELAAFDKLLAELCAHVDLLGGGGRGGRPARPVGFGRVSSKAWSDEATQAGSGEVSGEAGNKRRRTRSCSSGRDAGSEGGVVAADVEEAGAETWSVRYSSASCFQDDFLRDYHYEPINASAGDNPGHLLFPEPSEPEADYEDVKPVACDTDDEQAQAMQRLLRFWAQVEGHHISDDNWQQLFPCPPPALLPSLTPAAGSDASQIGGNVSRQGELAGHDAGSRAVGALERSNISAGTAEGGVGAGEEEKEDQEEDGMSNAVREDLWRIEPVLAHDAYVARLIAAHDREQIVYTIELAQQIAEVKGYDKMSPDDIKLVSERAWGVYVPTCTAHADALKAINLPVNLTAANLSYEVPPIFRRHLADKAQRPRVGGVAGEEQATEAQLTTADGDYVFVPPAITEAWLEADQRREEEEQWDPLMLDVLNEIRAEHREVRHLYMCIPLCVCMHECRHTYALHQTSFYMVQDLDAARANASR